MSKMLELSASPTVTAMEAGTLPGSATPHLDEKKELSEEPPAYSDWIMRPSLSILKPTMFLSAISRKTRPFSRTSYLDGLRGLACLFVVLHHSTELFFPWVRGGFLSSPEATNILSIPIIRLWFGGHAMVDIFFVISGYVLSAKALRLAREGKSVEAYKSIASSTLRRLPRIHIPCLVHTFIVAICTYMHWIGDRGVKKWYPQPTMMAEFTKWFKDSLVYLDPLSSGHGYEPHLWTMPHEIIGSLIVFVSCLALAKSSNTFRSLTLIGMAAYWLYMVKWYFFLFTSGMVCADVYLHFNPPSTGPILLGNDDNDQDSTPRDKRSPLIRALHAIGIFICLWILSCPRWDEGADHTPGYTTLVALIPPSWRGETHQSLFWFVVTAPIFIILLDAAGPASMYQKFLTGNFCQYLGDVSFSLYLCHGLFLNTVAISMVWGMCEKLGIDRGAGGLDYVAVLGVTAIVVFPMCFWWADVYTRVVDRGAIRLAGRLTKL